MKVIVRSLLLYILFYIELLLKEMDKECLVKIKDNIIEWMKTFKPSVVTTSNIYEI
jgi:hypothetical protein